MRKLSAAVTFLLFACAICLGQATYLGLTAGKSTRAEVDRALGQPVRLVSGTLVEYRSPEAAGKLFVQYRDDSAAAVVERIELTCSVKMGGGPVCDSLLRPVTSLVFDARVLDRGKEGTSSRATVYFNAPRFIRLVEIWKPGNEVEYRAAFFSPDLYEAAVPKGGCAGTISGTWDTDPLFTDRPETNLNLGRVRIEKDGGGGFKGTYQKNNGSFTLRLDGGESQNFIYGHSRYKGGWKDDAGTGTVVMTLRNDFHSIHARFDRAPGGATPPRAAPKKPDAARTPYDTPSYADNWIGKCAP